MKMKSALIVVVIVLLLSGGVYAEGAESPNTFRRNVFFFDSSRSVSSDQRLRWVEQAKTVVSKMGCGDSLTIFLIHDRSLEAARLFMEAVPPIDSDPTQSELIACRLALKKIHRDVERALESYIKGRLSDWTDLFSAFLRIKPEDTSGKPTVLYVFSDLLHSTRDLDMETISIPSSDERLTQLVLDVARANHLEKGMLQGTEVYALLNAAQPGSATPVNNRRVLKQFWGKLFSHLGANLVSFDTDLPLN